MGVCFGGNADPQDREVQKEIDKERVNYAQEIKLLLLGAGGSGKSTLFKQLEYIHGEGFTPRQRQLFQKQIHEQLVESMKLLISRCEEYWERDPELYAKYQLYDYTLDYDDAPSNPTIDDETQNLNDKTDEEDIRDSAEAILSIRSSQKLTKEVQDNLIKLWKHPVIQAMFTIRNEICVPDSTEYFFDEMDRITSDDYVPDDKDLLMVRYRTTGMQEKTFEIRGHNFKICDVGGQRNERRKWIHFFSNVTSVIFVVSLSSYDELTFEDEENAMGVGLEVYEEQINSEWFEDVPFILFLNKSDLFEDKIVKVPISVAPCFNEYKGPPNDQQAALTFIREVFTAANRNKSRQQFMHVTNATNTNQIEKVFNDVQTMIINWSLEKAGLT
eukprot:3066_1